MKKARIIYYDATDEGVIDIIFDVCELCHNYVEGTIDIVRKFTVSQLKKDFDRITDDKIKFVIKGYEAVVKFFKGTNIHEIKLFDENLLDNYVDSFVGKFVLEIIPMKEGDE